MALMTNFVMRQNLASEETKIYLPKGKANLYFWGISIKKNTLVSGVSGGSRPKSGNIQLFMFFNPSLNV